MEAVVLAMGGLVMSETLRVMVVSPGRTVVDKFETLMIWPVAVQVMLLESELVAESAAETVQVPLAMVMLVGSVMKTTAPTPKGLVVCITNEQVDEVRTNVFAGVTDALASVFGKTVIVPVFEEQELPLRKNCTVIVFAPLLTTELKKIPEFTDTAVLLEMLVGDAFPGNTIPLLELLQVRALPVTLVETGEERQQTRMQLVLDVATWMLMVSVTKLMRVGDLKSTTKVALIVPTFRVLEVQILKLEVGQSMIPVIEQVFQSILFWQLVEAYVRIVIEQFAEVVGGFRKQDRVKLIEVEAGTAALKKLEKAQKAPTVEVKAVVLTNPELVAVLIARLEEFEAGVQPLKVSCKEPPAGIGFLLTILKMTALQEVAQLGEQVMVQEVRISGCKLLMVPVTGVNVPAPLGVNDNVTSKFETYEGFLMELILRQICVDIAKFQLKLMVELELAEQLYRLLLSVLSQHPVIPELLVKLQTLESKVSLAVPGKILESAMLRVKTQVASWLIVLTEGQTVIWGTEWIVVMREVSTRQVIMFIVLLVQPIQIIN